MRPLIAAGPVTFRDSRDRLYYNLSTAGMALIYGAVCSQLPSELFKDWANYLAYGEYSWQTLVTVWEIGLLPTLANEPVWLLINSGLALVLPPESVARTIVFGAASIVAWLTLRSDPRNFIWLIVVLLLPQVVKNHLIHLRQGTAIAVFLLGWFSTRRSLRWLLIGVTPFIHASFAFVLLILALASVIRYLRFAADLRTLVFVCVGVTIGNLLGWLAAAVGARQSETYAFTMTDLSGLGFLFWSMVFLLMTLQGPRFLRAHAFQVGGIIFYLATYFFIEVTARIFESMLILILLACLRMTGWRRMAFTGAIVVYGSLLWLIRLESPLMGFGLQ